MAGSEEALKPSATAHRPVGRGATPITNSEGLSLFASFGDIGMALGCSDMRRCVAFGTIQPLSELSPSGEGRGEGCFLHERW